MICHIYLIINKIQKWDFPASVISIISLFFSYFIPYPPKKGGISHFALKRGLFRTVALRGVISRMTEYTRTPRAKKIPRIGVVPWIRDGTLPKGRGSWRLKKFVRDLLKKVKIQAG